MSGPISPFGQYQSQQTYALSQIDSSKYPDTNKDFQKNLERLNQFVDYIASYLQTMQKGIDQANEDSLQKIQDLATNLTSLLGGGQLLFGINLGDLQYYLPALGALFGFSGTDPFPINLFDAAEQFFLGYVVPLSSFSTTINNLISAWLEGLGFNANFINALENIVSAFGSIAMSAENLLTTLYQLLGIFGLTSGNLGPFSSLWQAVTSLLGGGSFSDFGTWFNPILAAAAPWLQDIADLLNDFNTILKAFSGGTITTTGLVNLANLFTPYLNLLTAITDPIASWGTLLGNVLTIGTIPGLSGALGSLLPTSSFQSIIDGVLGGTNNPFSAFTSFLTGTNTTATNANTNATNALTQLASLATGLLGTGSSITDVVNWLLGMSSSLGSTTGIANSAFNNLQTIIDEVLGGSGNPISAFISFLQGLLGSNSPLNALNIFGLIQPGNIAQVGVGQIGSTVTNLLINPNFQGIGSLDGAGIFTWDGTVGMNGLLGAAKAIANGTTKDLLSNAIAVTPNQVINTGGWAQWTNLITNAGTNPIQIAINAYSAGSLISQTVVATLAGSPATSTWQQLTGSQYTVASGIDTIRQVLHITADATGGNVWFTNLNLSKTGLLPTNLIMDLASGNPLSTVLALFQSNFTNIFGQLLNFVNISQWTSLLNVFGGSTTSAQSLINSFLTGGSPLNASNLTSGSAPLSVLPDVQTTMDNIVQNLLGLSGSGFGHTQVNTALANTQAALTAAQASIATLTTAQTSGLAIAEAFTDNGTSSSSPGSNWLVINQGHGGHFGTPSGSSLSWVGSGLSTNEEIDIWQGTNPQTVGDYQIATIILSNTGGNFLGATGYNDIWLRVSSSSTSYANVTGIRFRWGANGSMAIDRFVNGVQTTLNSAPANTITAPGSSVALTAIAGQPGAARTFLMQVNNNTVMTEPEIGSGSQVGVGFRGFGVGGRAEGLLLPPTQQGPATIHQFNAADQAA